MPAQGKTEVSREPSIPEDQPGSAAGQKDSKSQEKPGY